MTNQPSFSRYLKRVLCMASVAAIFVSGNSAFAASEVLRIGYQKYGTLVILKARGTLERRLEGLGVAVKWTEFPAGPQLLEGLNVGSIDFGTVGEAPPIFAQAAGADLVYVGNEPAAPRGEAIVVPANSPILNVAQLRGKRVALNKGSNVHYLLVRALEKAGVPFNAIEPVYLPPADARAAFERGSVDAWVIWDPFYAAVEQQTGARVLVDGQGLVANHQFYLASRSYAVHRAEIVRIVLEELVKVDDWGRANPREVADFLAPSVGLPPEILERAALRYSYGVTPVSDEVMREQQRIADVFSDLKLIPRRIVVLDATVPTPPATAQR
jgi:sulfonate transport system substrate-binding protein